MLSVPEFPALHYKQERKNRSFMCRRQTRVVIHVTTFIILKVVLVDEYVPVHEAIPGRKLWSAAQFAGSSRSTATDWQTNPPFGQACSQWAWGIHS